MRRNAHVASQGGSKEGAHPLLPSTLAWEAREYSQYSPLPVPLPPSSSPSPCPLPIPLPLSLSLNTEGLSLEIQQLRWLAHKPRELLTMLLQYSWLFTLALGIELGLLCWQSKCFTS